MVKKDKVKEESATFKYQGINSLNQLLLKFPSDANAAPLHTQLIRSDALSTSAKAAYIMERGEAHAMSAAEATLQDAPNLGLPLSVLREDGLDGVDDLHYPGEPRLQMQSLSFHSFLTQNHLVRDLAFA
jgi:hypothetical protein